MKSVLLTLLATLSISGFFSSNYALADDKAIIVLDASGSMWGQIDGKPKISIARDTLSKVIGDFPAGMELGLMAYGHRKKGVCEDIELLVEPASESQKSILAAVSKIKPKGKTPLSASVLKAAETLKYSEDKATVVLITDGLETCNADPCALGRKLEETGVDFTAHVVGFDLTKDQAKKVSCLAEETGGVYIDAANADQLSDALEETIVKLEKQPEPEPEPKPEPLATASLDAPETATAGSEVQVAWVGPDNKGDYISVAKADVAANKYEHYGYPRNGNPTKVKMPIEPGEYQLRYVAHNPHKILATRTITVVAAEVALDAPETATAGSEVQVAWVGPDNKGDYISVAKADVAANKYEHYGYPRNGNPTKVKMPIEPGEYQLRYVAHNPHKILATRTITVVAAEVALDAPETATAGSAVKVAWVGPDNKGDYISVAEIGSDVASYINYQLLNKTNPTKLKLPEKTGNYLIRYVSGGNAAKVLARRAIKVVDANSEPAPKVVLEAAKSAPIGGKVEVFWVGPDGEGDAIVISKIGSNEALTSVPTSKGNPAIVDLPDTAGKYVLRYFSKSSKTQLGSRLIVVQ